MLKKRFTRAKRSSIWKIPLEELKQQVSESTSLGQVLKRHGLINKGRNSSTLKRRLIEERVDFSHMKMGIGSNKGRTFECCKMTRDEVLKHVFIEHSSYNRRTVKRYLRRFNLIPYECSECRLTDTWNGKPLNLQPDHINGVSDDNRLRNLRWMCPNCHSQTETFCGRRKKYEIRPEKNQTRARLHCVS